MENQFDSRILIIPLAIISCWLWDFTQSLGSIDRFLAVMVTFATLIIISIIFLNHFSPWGKIRQKRLKEISEIPYGLVRGGKHSVALGLEINLQIPIFLPNKIRTRHVHILGATGSGKTESVILNFIRQDVNSGLGSIILDAKGDHTFLSELEQFVPQDRLKVFDLGSPTSLSYNPTRDGTPLEAAQRLFSSLKWSEEYYKSKALSALQRIFVAHYATNNRNPTILEISSYLETPNSYIAFVVSPDFPQALAQKDYQDLSGLRDQVKALTLDCLAQNLSPNHSGLDLNAARSGEVIYFRLQSLMSPQIVESIGKLLINNLNFLAGTAHRGFAHAQQSELIPIYFDEFASFACPEFSDLISKARSAGFALHFSHQSIGDLADVEPGFLNRIADNSAVKIVLRINDPDSADFFARSFGTKLYQKTTQRITNAKKIESAEILGEGTTREAHQFRASPDLLKTLPTGVGSVLIAHGEETPHGGSTVLKIKFPRLNEPLGS